MRAAQIQMPGAVTGAGWPGARLHACALACAPLVTAHPAPPLRAEAYRRAVDVNPRDYRAWYGLGQTYELVNMPYYALYYFRRCAGCV